MTDTIKISRELLERVCAPRISIDDSVKWDVAMKEIRALLQAQPEVAENTGSLNTKQTLIGVGAVDLSADGVAALNEAEVVDDISEAPPADAADMGGQAGEEVTQQITIVQHLDAKGSRKALGAMNARLRCKVGHLERKIAEQCEELEILNKQLDRFRSQSHGIPALAEHERLSEELAQHRQQAGKLVEALRKIHFRADCFVEDDMDMRVPSIEAIVRIAREALADWGKTNA